MLAEKLGYPDVDELAYELPFTGLWEWAEFFKIRDEHEKAALKKAKSEGEAKQAAGRRRR